MNTGFLICARLGVRDLTCVLSSHNSSALAMNITFYKEEMEGTKAVSGGVWGGIHVPAS